MSVPSKGKVCCFCGTKVPQKKKRDANAGWHGMRYNEPGQISHWACKKCRCKHNLSEHTDSFWMGQPVPCKNVKEVAK